MSKLSLSALLFTTACATTGSTMDTRETSPHTRPHLDLAVAADDRAFPKAIEPQLPSVDRIAMQVRAHLGERAVASIDLCVAPDGQVTNVSLARGSAYGPFDAAMLHDAKEWQFASMPGRTATAKLQTCERVTVKYTVPN